jgi:hypothetical protein
LRYITYSAYIKLLLFAAFAAISLAARYWGLFVQWLHGLRGRDWATIPAVIDIVSVVPQTKKTNYGEQERIVSYLGTLTYCYRNPELQMGDFSRMFGTEVAAKAWVGSYKGRSVMVHVDPRDPSQSVLRKEEL